MVSKIERSLEQGRSSKPSQGAKSRSSKVVRASQGAKSRSSEEGRSSQPGRSGQANRASRNQMKPARACKVARAASAGTFEPVSALPGVQFARRQPDPSLSACCQAPRSCIDGQSRACQREARHPDRVWSAKSEPANALPGTQIGAGCQIQAYQRAAGRPSRAQAPILSLPMRCRAPRSRVGNQI